MLLSKDLFIAHSWEPLTGCQWPPGPRWVHGPYGFPYGKAEEHLPGRPRILPQRHGFFFFSFFFVGRFKRNDDSAKKGGRKQINFYHFLLDKSLDFGGPSCIAPSREGGPCWMNRFFPRCCAMLFLLKCKCWLIAIFFEKNKNGKLVVLFMCFPILNHDSWPDLFFVHLRRCGCFVETWVANHLGYGTNFVWSIYLHRNLVVHFFFQHTPATCPRPLTNSLWRKSFHIFLLQGYVGLPLRGWILSP